jgi:hypothetical protein
VTLRNPLPPLTIDVSQARDFIAEKERLIGPVTLLEVIALALAELDGQLAANVAALAIGERLGEQLEDAVARLAKRRAEAAELQGKINKLTVYCGQVEAHLAEARTENANLRAELANIVGLFRVASEQGISIPQEQHATVVLIKALKALSDN